MRFPDELLYHPEHAWALLQGEAAMVGITDHAQSELGEIVYVELPEPGRVLSVGEVFGSVESSKSISELISPVAGEVVEANGALEDSPEMINDDPYGDGWMIRVRLNPDFDRSGLLDATAYSSRVSGD